MDEGIGVAELIPQGEYDCVIAPSRDLAITREIRNMAYEVQEMDKNESADLLVQCSGERGKTTRSDAIALVRLLGYLPLAIEQAGGYIRSSPITIALYTTLFKTSSKLAMLQEGLPRHKKWYKGTVVTTRKISFDRIRDVDPCAIEILRFFAFLNRTRIQLDLLRDGPSVFNG